MQLLLILTVLMLTLMTGMRERQDDAGSGLSALIFTLHREGQTVSHSSLAALHFQHQLKAKAKASTRPKSTRRENLLSVASVIPVQGLVSVLSPTLFIFFGC